MFPEKRIDDLIEAGWHVLDSDFDTAAFQHWRKQAFECLTDLLGPDHAYTRSFRNHVQSLEEEERRTRGGTLTAAGQGLSINRTGKPEQTS